MRIIAPCTWQHCCPDYDLTDILQSVDNAFHPSLSSQHNLTEFSAKLQEKACIFLAGEDRNPEGVMAAYLNKDGETYISIICVFPSSRNKGVGVSLLRMLQQEVKMINGRSISCRVSVENVAARAMYKRAGFVEDGDIFNIIGTEKIMVVWKNPDFK